MIYQVVNRLHVHADILNTIQYYKTVSSELPGQFLFRIREATNYIARYPFAFPVKYKNVRTILLKQFPYHLHYLVDDSQKRIVILAVIHAYKNPMDYSSR